MKSKVKIIITQSKTLVLPTYKHVKYKDYDVPCINNLFIEFEFEAKNVQFNSLEILHEIIGISTSVILLGTWHVMQGS